MAANEFVVDVHHHFMPPALFDRLAAQAGGRGIVTYEIKLTLHPSRKGPGALIKVTDEGGINTALSTDQVQVMGAVVARILNAGIAEVQPKSPDRFGGAVHLPVHE